MLDIITSAWVVRVVAPLSISRVSYRIFLIGGENVFSHASTKDVNVGDLGASPWGNVSRFTYM